MRRMPLSLSVNTTCPRSLKSQPWLNSASEDISTCPMTMPHDARKSYFLLEVLSPNVSIFVARTTQITLFTSTVKKIIRSYGNTTQMTPSKGSAVIWMCMFGMFAKKQNKTPNTCVIIILEKYSIAPDLILCVLSNLNMPCRVPYFKS